MSDAPLSTAEALARVLALMTPTGVETIPLSEAGGRALAAPVYAERDQPPFDASAMDGYAVRSADAANGARLAVVGEIPAGARYEGEVGPGQAVRIFTGAPVPEERLAQEAALLAVKADVREELDRLTSHVAAGRALLKEKGPVGRQLDFLTQEFNREANTLCSKSPDTALTRIGLDLKAQIDQLKEQVQNVE